jgi:AcrR family transcriptional regulator
MNRAEMRQNRPQTAALRERQRDFTRTYILVAGLEAFSERGYSQVTVDGLLRRCGCARGTFYAYFPGGKDEVFQTIYRKIGEEFEQRFRESLANTGDDLVEVIRSTAEILMDISAEPGKGRFFMIEAPALPHVLGNTLGRTTRGIVQVLTERIERAQTGGLLDPSVNAAELSSLVMGILRAVTLQVANGEASPDEILRAVDALITGALDFRTRMPARAIRKVSSGD